MSCLCWKKAQPWYQHISWSNRINQTIAKALQFTIELIYGLIPFRIFAILRLAYLYDEKAQGLQTTGFYYQTYNHQNAGLIQTVILINMFTDVKETCLKRSPLSFQIAPLIINLLFILISINNYLMKLHKILLIAVIFAISSPQLNYEISYSTASLIPTFPLGFIGANSQLTIQLKINTATSAAADFTFNIRNNANTLVVTASVFTTTAEASVIKATVTIADQGGYTVQVIPPTSGTPSFYHVFTISAFIKVNNNLVPVFQNFVDFVRRDKMIKYFYASQAKSITVVHKQASVPTGKLLHRIIDVADASNMKYGSTVSLATPVQIVNDLKYTLALTKGYHALQITTSLAGSITFPSDAYVCPYAIGSTDINYNLPGCSATSVAPPSTFPCLSFVGISSTCAVCYPGYKIINDICTYNPCAQRQYFVNSVCLPVSPTCLTFNPTTGACQTCISNSYTLSNGVCTLSTCPAGSTIVGNTCKNDYCKDIVPITGECLSCISNAFFLSNKLCYPVFCFLSNYYYSAVSLACVPYPAFCTTVDLTTQICTSCVNGHQLINRNCVALCNTTQFAVNGVCYNLPFRCLELNNILQCSRCQTGYQTVAGVCTLIPASSGTGSTSNTGSGSTAGSSSGSSSGSGSNAGSDSNTGSNTNPSGQIIINRYRYCRLLDVTSDRCIECHGNRPIINGICQQ